MLRQISIVNLWVGFVLQLVSSAPNVIFFLTDDWGFNDVGYHENTNTQTPFIDEIALEDSLIIEKYYALHLCTMTRCAILTGRHTIRYGMQANLIEYESNYALTKKEMLISEEFQNQGYHTHAIGKWHVGHMTWDYTPTKRGFDTFMGYYGGSLYYYEHLGMDDYYDGFDMRYGMDPWDEPHSFSLDIWSKYTQDIINEESKQQKESDDANSFFIYLAWQGSHNPSESVASYYDLYAANLTSEEISSNNERLNFQAQTTHSDRLFKSIVDNLKSTGIWDNTLIIFSSDNGAIDAYGDNSPLRGSKATLFEAGVRLPAFITGGFLPSNLRGKTFDEFPIHVTDWYPTLLSACGLQITRSTPQTLDGVNMWHILMTAEKNSYEYYETRRNAWDSMTDESSQKDFNQIIGNTVKNSENDFVRMSEKYNFFNSMNGGNLASLESITKNRVMLVSANSYQCSNDICGALIYGGRWKIVYSDNELSTNCFWERTFEVSTHDILGCGAIPSDVNVSDCACETEVCLFDLLNDPCEYYNVKDNHPALTQQLYYMLSEYYNIQATPLYESVGLVDNTSVVEPVHYDDSGIGWWGPWDKTEEWKLLEFELKLNEYYQHMSLGDETGIVSDPRMHEDADSEITDKETSKTVRSGSRINNGIFAGVVIGCTMLCCLFYFCFCHDKKINHAIAVATTTTTTNNEGINNNSNENEKNERGSNTDGMTINIQSANDESKCRYVEMDKEKKLVIDECTPLLSH